MADEGGSMETQEPLAMLHRVAVHGNIQAAFRRLCQAVPMLQEAATLLKAVGDDVPWAKTSASVTGRAVWLARDAADQISKQAGVMADLPDIGEGRAERLPAVTDLRCADCRFWKQTDKATYGWCRFDPPGPNGWVMTEPGDACGKHEAVTP